MAAKLQTAFTSEMPTAGDTPLRVFVLGAVYAAAVLFAVVFSPAMGFVTVAPEAGTAVGAQTAGTQTARN